MGIIKLDNNRTYNCEELEEDYTIQQLYEDASCEQYTDSYRMRIIRAWGSLGREGWAILSYLHELTKNSSLKLSNVAKEAIRKIDPGMPLISKESTNDNPYRDESHKQPKKFQVQATNGFVWKELAFSNVTITDIPYKKLTDGTHVTGICNFCSKQCYFPEILQSMNHDLVGSGKLFCSFCLQNEHYKAYKQQNTLIMSFRGLIGYYYYSFHVLPTSPSMQLPELDNIINFHAKIGQLNPLFKYDSDSYLWFVDFSRVGNKPKQMGLKYVLDTVVDILFTFNLYENVRACSPSTLFDKFKEAITIFHHHRKRPVDQKILIPTLYNCGIPDVASKGIPAELLKSFVSSQLIENYKRKKQQ